MLTSDNRSFDVYLLPLFTENLRSELDFTQEKLQEIYITVLFEDIRQMADDLIKRYEECISQDAFGQHPAVYNITKNPRKKMIGFHGQLTRALEEANKHGFSISYSQFEKTKASIHDSVNRFEQIERSGGGTEIRKIRDILNPDKPPLKDKHDELEFVLARCFPRFFWDNKNSFSYFRKHVLRQSPEQTLFSYKENIIKSQSIKKINRILGKVQRDPFVAHPSTKQYDETEARKAFEAELTGLFKEVEQILTEEYKVEVSISKRKSASDADYAFDPASLGASHAKNILYALSGLNRKAVDENWDEISESVYRIVVEAESLSDRVYYDSIGDYQLTSRELLFVEEFILLFFSDSKIRKMVNSLSQATQ